MEIIYEIRDGIKYIMNCPEITRDYLDNMPKERFDWYFKVDYDVDEDDMIEDGYDNMEDYIVSLIEAEIEYDLHRREEWLPLDTEVIKEYYRRR